jgi:sarcosine reductase
MRLEVGNVSIMDVQFGSKTEIKNGVLFINCDELLRLLKIDKRLANIHIELAHPGESVRICRVRDVIEPRARIGKRKGEFPFPGALGVRGTAGDGGLNALRGVCVTLTDQGGPYLIQSDMGFPSEKAPIGLVIDMSGAGAEVSPFGKMHHVVIVADMPVGVHEEDYALALRIAGLRAAAYLGRAGEDLKPDSVEVFELPPVPEITKGKENLPKVGFILQVHWGQWYAIDGEPIYYGDDCKRLQPTIVHPNEVLDGAVIRSYFGMGTSTYALQNHPVITELYRRHGKDLCFMGVILDMSICFEPERERAVNAAAKLAKDILGLDGVILNKFGGGAPMVDTSQRALACEKRGIRSVMIMADPTYRDGGSGLLFNQPECNAIVNTGGLVLTPKMSAQARVIGRPADMQPPATGGFSEGFLKLMGASDQMGFSQLRAFHAPEYRQEIVEKNAAQRAVDMLLAKLAGELFESEVPLPKFEHPTPAPPIKDLTKANIALVTSGCLIPRGNPDNLAPGFSPESFGEYSIKDVNRICSDMYKPYHVGLRLHYIEEDPQRLLPVDVMRDLEREGVIGKLNDTFYSYAGVGTSVETSRNIAKGIIKRLKANKVDAVILTAT